MPLEVASYINGLVSTNPVSTDGLSQADDHLRLIKATIKNTFPNITSVVTASHAELNKLDGFTGTYLDLNYARDLRSTGVTNTEFDYLDGVTSNIQTQLNTLTTSVGNINTDLVNDTSPQLGGNLDTNSKRIVFGSWYIQTNGTSLSFYYNNTERFRLGSTGSFYAEGDVGAYVNL